MSLVLNLNYFPTKVCKHTTKSYDCQNDKSLYHIKLLIFFNIITVPRVNIKTSTNKIIVALIDSIFNITVFFVKLRAKKLKIPKNATTKIVVVFVTTSSLTFRNSYKSLFFSFIFQYLCLFLLL